MRLTLDLDAEMHRKIKTLAAFHGQTVQSFILSKLGLEGMDANSGIESDETAYLFSTPANAEHLEKERASGQA